MPMMTAKRHTLANGLTVVTVPMASVESLTVLALVNVGSRYERKAHWGISHFLEHMVFKGTEKYPDPQTLSAAVDAVGAKFNAFTSKEYTGYYVKAAAAHFELALDVVSDMLLTPQLRQEDIDREKGVIIEEMNMYADMPASHIANLFEEMMFESETLGHDVIGIKESVSALKTADFREHLHRWYGLSNMVVIIAGSADILERKETLSKIEKMFDKGDAVEREKNPEPLKHLGKSPITKKQHLVEKKKTEQAHFILAFPGYKRTDPRRYALSLLSVILGGNMSSRLFMEIREKRGLCYYIHSDHDLYHDVGIFGASAGVDPQRVDEAVGATFDQFMQLVNGKRPVTVDELQRAKDYFTGQLILSLEDSESVAQYFGMRQLLTGTMETPEELLKKYHDLTLEDVQRAAEDVVRADAVRFAIIGPFADKERFQKLLVA